MKFFDNIFKRDKAIPPVVEERSEPGAISFVGVSNFKQNEAMTIAAVFRAVNIISDSIAQINIHTYSTDEDGFIKRDVDNPLQILINKRPNKRQTRYQFIKQLVSSMLLHGNAYAYIERDIHGKPIGLHYIMPELVTVVPDMFLQNPPTYHVVGIPEPVKAEDMIHILNVSIDGIVGISTLTYANKVLELAHAENEHSSDFFLSGASTFGIIKTPKLLSEEQKRKIRQSWEKAKTGHGSGLQPGIVILDNEQSYQPVSVNPADAQLLSSREFSIVEIARMFNVPPSMLYVQSSVSYSSLEMSMLQFQSDTLAPIIEKFSQEFERKLFPAMNVEIRFAIDDMIKLDQKSKADYYSRLVLNGIMQPNEARLALGLPQIDNGDTNFMPVNVMPIDKAINNTATDDKIVTEDTNKVTETNEEKIS